MDDVCMRCQRTIPVNDVQDAPIDTVDGALCLDCFVRGRDPTLPAHVPPRLAQHITPMRTGCWRWDGRHSRNGYGRIRVDGREVAAHRLLYQVVVDGLSAKRVLDHRCRNRWCVNPAHLEPVSGRVNTCRGESPAGRNSRKTECVRGHPLAGPGSDVRRDSRGKRVCRHCERERRRQRRQGE